MNELQHSEFPKSDSVGTSNGAPAVTSTNGTNIIQKFSSWIRSPEGQEAIEELVEKNLPNIITRLVKNSPLFQTLMEPLPAPGHETLLVQTGHNATHAKLKATLISHCGKLRAEEKNNIKKPFTSAFLKLARASGKSPLVISRRAKKLLPLLNEGIAWTFIENAATKAGIQLEFNDFCDVVNQSANRDEGQCQKLVKIAQKLECHMPNPRGKRLSVATAIHLFLLLERRQSGLPCAYSWNDEIEDFIDPATQATRGTLNDNYFDPRSAYRLLKLMEL